MSIHSRTAGALAALALLVLPSLTLAQSVSQAAYHRALNRIAELEAQQTVQNEEGDTVDGEIVQGRVVDGDYFDDDVVEGFGQCDSCGGAGCDSCGGGGGYGSCYDGFCGDNCNGGYCDPCCNDGFYMLYENVIVKPFFSRDTAYVSPSTVDSVTSGWSDNAFDWNMKYSPRVELGFRPTCGNLGLRARYWYYDNAATFMGVDSGNTISAAQSINLDVVDLEATANKNGLIYSAGLRYARLDQDYSAQSSNLNVLLNNVQVRQTIEGVGPTLGIQGTTCNRWCGFGLFAKARGSLLYGDSSSRFTSSIVDTTSTGVVGNRHNDLLSIAELQFGINWQHCCGWTTWYLSAALEAQYWYNAGSGAAGMVTNATNYYNESAYSADMGFLGGTFGVGLLW